MPSISLTKKEMDAIRFAHEMIHSLREGADEKVVENWPMEELAQVENKMRAANRRARRE
jgi:hypothetical protein